MNVRRVLQTLSIVLTLSCGSAAATAQTLNRPNFVAEPISVFADAYRKAKNTALDARHADEMRFRAYRFFSTDGPAVVIAKSVTIKGSGHLQITGEPGTSASGRIVKGGGDVHILLPVNVAPPR
jgi:zona occludens toxin (predicted ATPase)